MCTTKWVFDGFYFFLVFFFVPQHIYIQSLCLSTKFSYSTILAQMNWRINSLTASKSARRLDLIVFCSHSWPVVYMCLIYTSVFKWLQVEFFATNEEEEKICPKIYGQKFRSFYKSDESKMWFLVFNVNDVQRLYPVKCRIILFDFIPSQCHTENLLY